MSFEHDAFISYTHLDNEILPTEKKGWVSLFEEAVTQLLSQFHGRKVKIWRDPKLKGNDKYSDEILDKLRDCAVLISILSPRYVQSDWCKREVLRFYEDTQGGQAGGNKSRIIKVVKVPMADDQTLPPPVGEALQQMLGYRFFDLKEAEDALEMYDPAFGDQPRQKFLKLVLELVRDVKRLLDELGGIVVPSEVKPAVYLAECTYDRSDERAAIQAELKRLGYEVLPRRDLPREETAFVAEVERLLSKCALSIHFVGTGYGAAPYGPSEKSNVMLQNEIAVRASRDKGLKRIISLPAGTKSTNAVQQEFIERLHRDEGLQLGADLITGGPEELKTAVRSALKDVEKTADDAAAHPAEKLIYLLCDSRDKLETVPVVKHFRERGLNVQLTIFTGDAADVRTANEKSIMTADAIVLFYGAGDEAWMHHQQNELKRVRGMRRQKPPRIVTVLALPGSDDKQFLAGTENDVIDCRDGFSAERLKLLDEALGLS